MPRVAQLYPLPMRFADGGIVRYGFHGLSCESIIQQLTAEPGSTLPSRLIIAHLGNGSSMTAVANGRSIETTMGFTPTGGLMMGSRSGDLDPGVLLHLLDAHGMTPSEISALVNKESGLVGVSGLSGDMRELLRLEATAPAAADAIDLYCYLAKKSVAALAATLGGLDMLAFTGGIGEHAAPVRERICAGLEFLGVVLDRERNANHEPVISHDLSTVMVRVMETDEESVIARHVSRLMAARGEADVSV